MPDSDTESAISPLNLPEELVMMLLNEQTGYFHQVPGWSLNCAVMGAVLAELSLLSRIDFDLTNLSVVDQTPTGDRRLDPYLEMIAAESEERSARYWIERLAVHADSVIDQTLDNLVSQKILKHHNGDFWTVTGTGLKGMAGEHTAGSYIKSRISDAIFTDTIPFPRDSIVVSLVRACDVLRFIFEIDKEAEERVDFVCRLELIGHSIAEAVEQNIANPMLQRSTLTKQIPRVPMRELLTSSHLWNGNIPALFGTLAEKFGPVFELRPPFNPRMVFLAGPDANRWVQRKGRQHLRARDYFVGFENVYGASGVLPSLDGGDHFRLRRAMSPAYSRARLESQLGLLYRYMREFMSEWSVGDVLPANYTCRRLLNAQISKLYISIDSQDLLDDMVVFKERALNVHILRILPKIMMHTPGIRRRRKAIEELMGRIQTVYTPAQRAGCPRNLADDVLGLNSSDPQLVPETNLRFALSATMLASVYSGDMFTFAAYAMVSQPELYERIQSEADALFADGDPAGEDFTMESTDVTHRFLLECMRMYPIVPMSMRDVMNSCVVEGFALPVGSRVYIAQTASHYMKDVFPDPFAFDIDRYLPSRGENRGAGFAPYGLGTHRCLGNRWLELQLIVNLLMVARHFDLKIHPENYKLKIAPLPSMKPNKKLSFRVAEKRHELPV